jgi:hypothetical protein
MIKRRILGFLIVVAHSLTSNSCGPKNKVNTLQKDNIVVEVKQLGEGNYFSGTGSESVYDIRISTVNPELFAQVSQGSMWFKMDSCFWITENGENFYPEIIEPVANGLKNSFEYVVHFNRSFDNNANLFFKDTFINNKTYRVALN